MMKTIRLSFGATVLFALAATSIHRVAWSAAPDLRNKVVLANPDRYRVTLRFGKTQRNVEPRKASVLSPKRYPLTLEHWSGKPAVGWAKTQIASAGVYDFRWQGGQWNLSRRAQQTAQTSRSTARKAPTYRRSTGSYQRTVRRPTYVQRVRTPVYRGPRWPYRSQ